MKIFYKIMMVAIMVVVAFSCTCNRQTPAPTEDDTEVTDSLAPLEYELVTRETFFSPDSTKRFTLLEGCVIYVSHDDDAELYGLLKGDMIDDKQNYKDVLVRMGMLNDGTEVKGYMNVHTLIKHKRLR